MLTPVAGLMLLTFGVAQSPVNAVRMKDGHGGGFLDGGIRGEYFNNTTFQGTPAFTRRDVRIDFDWGSILRPGGSNSGPFRRLTTENYSVRWTGRLAPRFSETYTFSVLADDRFQLEIRPSGGGSYTTLINVTSPTAAPVTATADLVAGQRYDVRIRYVELNGTAFAKLAWSSASTPVEIVGPATQMSVNMNTYYGTLWANAADAGRNSWQGVSQWDPGSGGQNWPEPDVDANGYPTATHFGLIIHEIFGSRIQPMMKGRMQMVFKGRANTLFTVGNLRFANGATQVNGLAHYNSTTNTTVIDLEGFDNGWNIAQVGFSGAYRGPNITAAPGITSLRISMPTESGGTSTIARNVIFHPKTQEAFSRFTVFRINMNTNNREVRWLDRTLPTFFNQRGGKSNVCPILGSQHPEFFTLENSMSWEHQIMFCNELGKDLYINLPHLVNDDYIRRVANMIRYGSNSSVPYTQHTPNPVFPPLNPNLKVYVELGNELWNWGSPRDYPAYHTWRSIIVNELTTNAANARIYNFDNMSTAIDASGWPVNYMDFFHRRTLLRTYQISEIFRSVFGDAAMMSRVRPLMYGWYNNTFNVQERIYGFADNYFNNASGNHVPNVRWNQPARPLTSYLYGGGGGAFYFGSGNPSGTTDTFPNSGFETPSISAGFTANPAGSGWTFSGPAGYAKPGTDSTIPPAFEGSQVLYLGGQGTTRGSVQRTFTIPASPATTSAVRGIAFRAVSRRKSGASQADATGLRVFVNNVDITAVSNWLPDANNNWSEVGYTPAGFDASMPWYTRQGWFTANLAYFTRSFEAPSGGTVTVRIENTSPQTDMLVYVDDVRLTTVDAVFAGGIPGAGQAFGQVTSGTYDFELFGQSSWAQAYGLEYATYEGGWSLGGDNGGSLVQNWAKYYDVRAKQSNIDALNSFHRAGGFLPTFGTYNQWPQFSDQFYVEGMLNTADYPLVQGIDASNAVLPLQPENGYSLPGVLTPRSITLTLPSFGANPAQPNSPGAWTGWNVLAPRAAVYRVNVDATTGGTLRLVINGRNVLQQPGGPAQVDVALNQGIHNIRVQSVQTGFTINKVTVSMVGAPASPEITGIEDGNGSVTVSWGAVSGATGYIVRVGLTPDRMNLAFNAGSSTSRVVQNLLTDTTYYVEVLAYNANAWSLPSAQRSFRLLADGQVGSLVQWDFTGSPNGQEVSVPPASGTSRLTVTNLVRGPGYAITSYTWPNVFGLEVPNGQRWGSNLADAVTKNMYVEFQVTPKAGTRLSCSSIRFWASAQFSQGNPSQGGMGMTYRVGTGAFSAPITIGTFGQSDGTRRFSQALSGISALQGVSQRVTIRLYLYANDPWNWGHLGLMNDSPSSRAAPGDQIDLEVIGSLGST
jgi:hypothetical protein